VTPGLIQSITWEVAWLSRNSVVILLSRVVEGNGTRKVEASVGLLLGVLGSGLSCCPLGKVL